MRVGKSGKMLKQLQEIYQGKKVFLTGHTGFKGSWLLKILSILGVEVRGYALAPQHPFDLYPVLNGDTLCDSVIADLREKVVLKEALLDFRPDFVFHLAAQPLVRLSYEIPSETFEVNAIGTAYLLDAIRSLDRPCQVVLITTDKVYHNNEWLYPYRETDRLGGYDPYSASKAAAEIVIDSYRNCFFNINQYPEHQKAIAVARAGNVIGGGDWAKDRLIPDIVRALSKQEVIKIRNPNSIRPWQHVLEPLIGYLILGGKLVAEPRLHAQAYNFGPDSQDALPVFEMVDTAIKCWGSGSYEVIKTSAEPHEAGLLKLDISKAIAELNWKPKLNASQAIEKTINWYKQHLDDRQDITAFTEKQIIDYIEN